MDLSIIIPLYNEDESLPELCSWIESVVTKEQLSFEVIMVDDGSTDNSWNVIESIAAKNSCFKGIRFRRNYGKSAALNEGFKAAKGLTVITMDADMQDSPDEIPGLRNMIITEGYDMVSGWKKVRYDNTFTKNIPSKLYNAVARKASGIQLNDFNCGLKAYKIDVVKCIEVYGEMHRYIPILAKWSGFRKIGEKIVAHRARKYGVTKFGMKRFVNGFLDLATIMFLGKFGKKPMQLFGLWGSVFFLIGLGSSIYLIIGKLMVADFSLTNKPAFFIALTTMIIGVQLFLAGFVAELVSRNAPERNNYLIHKKLGLED
ncbi:MAG: glycosyltransferase family 2 protein [Bacteroidota bacterium]